MTVEKERTERAEYPRTQVAARCSATHFLQLTSSMFMDDLKLYTKSEQGLESLAHTVRVLSEDIGMDFGIEKCAKLLLRRGKDPFNTIKWQLGLVYANHTEVRANRVDARIVDKERKTVTLLEMSYPWIENRKQKEEEKTRKYAPHDAGKSRSNTRAKRSPKSTLNIVDVLGDSLRD